VSAVNSKLIKFIVFVAQVRTLYNGGKQGIHRLIF